MLTGCMQVGNHGRQCESSQEGRHDAYQTFPEACGRDVRGRAGRDFRPCGRHRLRQGRRAGQARGRLSALLHRVVVGRDHAQQEVLREVPAQGLHGRFPDRPAGRDHRQQPARGQAAHRLLRRHAGHRIDDQAGRGRHSSRCRGRHGLGPVQCVSRSHRRAEIRQRSGSDQMAEWQDGGRAQGQLHRPLRAGGIQARRDTAVRVSEPEHRGHHEQLPRRQARRRGDVGADDFAPGPGGAGAQGRDRRFGQ